MSDGPEEKDDESSHELPAPPQFLKELIRSIGRIPVVQPLPDQRGPEGSYENAGHQQPGYPNPLALVPPASRPLLATLHVLFPALVLPALDLLDQRRVVRWSPLAGGGIRKAARKTALYQIRGDTPHVVHLRAWHCTCAYFALRAAAAATTHTPQTAKHDETGDRGDRPDCLAQYAFTTPPCKHLLACLLAEEWPALRVYVVPETDCSAEVFAGVVTGDW